MAVFPVQPAIADRECCACATPIAAHLSQRADATCYKTTNRLIFIRSACRGQATAQSLLRSTHRRRILQSSSRPEQRALRALPAISLRSGLRFLEHSGLEPMALQQLVELGAVALGELRRLRDVAAGYLQEPDQVVALERLARLLERYERGGVLLERRGHERRRDHRRRRERD